MSWSEQPSVAPVAPGYASGYAQGPPPVLPRPPRPALPAPMRRAALWAGGLGFALMSLGWTLAATGAGILLFAGFFALLLGWIARVDPEEPGLESFDELTASIDTGAVTAVLIIAIVVGALLWVAGLLASRAILRRSGHPHPWGVTWAGLGIAVAASWLLSSLVSIVGQLVSATTSPVGGGSEARDWDGFLAALGPVIGIWVATAAVTALATIAAGALAWWWMAHAMRPGSAAAPGVRATPGTASIPVPTAAPLPPSPSASPGAPAH